MKKNLFYAALALPLFLASCSSADDIIDENINSAKSLKLVGGITEGDDTKAATSVGSGIEVFRMDQALTKAYVRPGDEAYCYFIWNTNDQVIAIKDYENVASDSDLAASKHTFSFYEYYGNGNLTSYGSRAHFMHTDGDGGITDANQDILFLYPNITSLSLDNWFSGQASSTLNAPIHLGKTMLMSCYDNLKDYASKEFFLTHETALVRVTVFGVSPDINNNISSLAMVNGSGTEGTGYSISFEEGTGLVASLKTSPSFVNGSFTGARLGVSNVDLLGTQTADFYFSVPAMEYVNPTLYVNSHVSGDKLVDGWSKTYNTTVEFKKGYGYWFRIELSDSYINRNK